MGGMIFFYWGGLVCVMAKVDLMRTTWNCFIVDVKPGYVNKPS
jgi:hypothetical protein